MNIRNRRTEVGASLETLSKISGASKATISLIENGITQNPGIKTIQAIETALDTLEAERKEAAGKENAKPEPIAATA